MFFGGDHPWIQIAEIEASEKYSKKWRETLNNEGLASSRKFLSGTLLISIAATIGAVGILTVTTLQEETAAGLDAMLPAILYKAFKWEL